MTMRSAAAEFTARFGPLFEAAPDAMVVANREGQIIAANGQAVALFGHSAEDLIGQPIEMLVPGRFRAAHTERRTAYAAGPHVRPMGVGLELYGVCKDGRELPLEISLSPITVGNDSLTIAAIRDSSRRRRIESKFRGLLEAAPDAIVVTSPDGRIRLVNGQTERLFGYSRDELLGSMIEILVPRRFAAVHPHHRASYAQDPHLRPMGAGLELFARRKDGTEFPVEISLSPIETEDGMLFTSVVRDVTERKRLEADIRRQNYELEQQNRQVQQASRMKSEFLANMSHELRTPLNSIIGFAEMMHDGRLGPIAEDHREYLGDILTSARHLLYLINDVLDLSKVESGMMEFFPEPVDVEALVADVGDMMHPLAVSKAIELECHVDPTVRTVVIDPSKLKQVISNYVSNALKFTPDRGRVAVRVQPEGDETFRVEVEDTGVGIREEDFSRLFVEFQQLDAGAAKRFQGTGLGLALTKRLVNAQGGHVGATSTPGIGSTFFAVLPRKAQIAPVAKRATAPIRTEAATGAGILVVDDDPAALRLLDTALRQRGLRATCTNNPDLALAVALEHPPDLLVVDLVMPGLPGVEFLTRFRAIRETNRTAVIVWTVKDITPVEREYLMTLAQSIVFKRDGGLSALLDRIETYLPPVEGASRA